MCRPFAKQVADLLEQEGRASAEHKASRSATGTSRSIGAIVEAGWPWDRAVARTSPRFCLYRLLRRTAALCRSLRAPFMLLSTFAPQHGQLRLWLLCPWCRGVLACLCRMSCWLHSTSSSGPSVVTERAFLRWLCHRPLPAAGEAKLSFCSEQLRFHAMTSLIQTKTQRITGT